MKGYTLQYLHLFIFKSSEESVLTLLEETVSYYPSYKVGDEITFMNTDKHDIVNKDVEIDTYIIKEVRSIIAVDKTEKHTSQHTLYIRVIRKEEDSDDKQDNNLNIDYLLLSMNPN